MRSLSFKRRFKRYKWEGVCYKPPNVANQAKTLIYSRQIAMFWAFQNEAVESTASFPKSHFLLEISRESIKLGNPDYDFQVGKMRRFYIYP